MTMFLFSLVVAVLLIFYLMRRRGRVTKTTGSFEEQPGRPDTA